MTADDMPGLIRLAPGVHVGVDRIAFTQQRSGGPGGQNVNKTASKVELRLLIADLGMMTYDARLRLASLAGGRVNDAGELVIACDETRSMRRNRELAIERLRELVLAALVVPKRRKKTRPGRNAIERRLKAKAMTGDRKRLRRDPGE
jgi:ribosome-associated protein